MNRRKKGKQARKRKSSSEIVATIPPPLDQSQRFTVDQTALYLKQSRAKTYGQIKAGEIATIDVGRRRYVAGTEIARLSSAA